jgi:hypothetical protein
LTKDFAKANMDHAQSSLPGEVAAALYYTSIAAALVRLGARITRLPDAELRRGLLWTSDQVWLDAETKQLLLQAAAKFAPGGPQEPPAP